MVFHSHINMNETPPSNSMSMSESKSKSSSLPPIPKKSSPPPPPTTVVKSLTTQKPLHNFSLPDLKWAMNHTNTNRFRKLSDSCHKSPLNATVPDNQKSQDKNNSKTPVLKTGDRTDKLAKRNSVGDDVAYNLVKKPPADSSSGDGSRSKLFIRIKTKSIKVADVVADAGDHNSVIPDDDSGDLLVPKTWNFRPRRLLTTINNVNKGDALKIGGEAAPEKKENDKEKGKDGDKDKEMEKVKKEKMKFSISLKKEEIEDDFFAMTGTKPSRRPMKRAKNVQKQLDYVFPGLWLASITPDLYKVNDCNKRVKG